LFAGACDPDRDGVRLKGRSRKIMSCAGKVDQEIADDLPEVSEERAKEPWPRLTTPTAARPTRWRPVSITELSRRPDNKVLWLLADLIPARKLTLLTALPKCGKTTWIAHLLAAMSRGDATFCGHPLRPCRTLIVTQEGYEEWGERQKALDLNEGVSLLTTEGESLRVFQGPANWPQWNELVNGLAQIVEENRFDLVIVDPLTDHWPVMDDSKAGEVRNALLPLRRINEAGAGVLLLHHPTKAGGTEGRAARGSIQLGAFVDMMIEMERPGGDLQNRTRRLKHFGRYGVAEELIELGEDGYTAKPTVTEADHKEVQEQAVLTILPKGRENAKSVKELAVAWNGNERVLRDILNRGTGFKWDRIGDGKKGSPARYYQ
jgi:hypothetical protein